MLQLVANPSATEPTAVLGYVLSGAPQTEAGTLYGICRHCLAAEAGRVGACEPALLILFDDVTAGQLTSGAVFVCCECSTEYRQGQPRCPECGGLEDAAGLCPECSPLVAQLAGAAR